MICAATVSASGCDLFEAKTVKRRLMLRIKPPPSGGAKIRQITATSDIAMRGARVDGAAGDYLLETEKMVAVVSRLDGEVIDFGPKGAKDAVVAFTPAIHEGLGAARAAVVFIGESEDAPGVLHIVRRGALPVRLHTFITFRGDLLLMESTLEPDSIADSGMVVGLGERFSFGNQPTWVQGYGYVRRDSIAQPAAFIAREGELHYAATVEGGKTMVRLGNGSLAGFFGAGRSSEFTFAASADQSPRRTVLVATSAVSIGDAAARLFDPKTMRTFEPPTSLPAGARVEVAECPTEEEERKPYARFAPDEPLVVPAEGCFESRIWAPGYTATKWAPIEDAAKDAMAPSGNLVVAVREAGKPAVCRIQVRGIDGTPSPDWGEDAEDGTAINVVHSKDGTLQRKVPPGKYRVIADRGFEYTAADDTVTVSVDQTTYVSMEVEHVVDTKGWVSADLHLHAEPSFDAPQTLEDRILNVAASGVEVAVATDHNRVTDYGPAIEKLGLEGVIASVVGDEVTTEEMAFGHFNMFPLVPGSEPLRWRRTSPARLFAESRARKPYEKGTIIQLNHPRMGDIGYFDVIRFDSKDIEGFVKRSPWASLDFDVIELFNGDDATSPSTVRNVMKDWYALLDSGRQFTAAGNSDSHRLTFHEPGLPRTWVAAPSDDLGMFDERAFVDALHAGKAIVSSGPFVRFRVGDADIGGYVEPGRHAAKVTVDFPPWMNVTYVEIIKNGKVVAKAEAPFDTKDHGAELGAMLDLEKGDWVIAIAGGTKEMDVLFRRGVPPFAFTNPIFVTP